MFLVSFMAGLTVLLIILSLRPQKRSMISSLRKFTSWQPIPQPPVIKLPAHRRFLAALGRFTPKRWQKKRDTELMRAGIPLKGGEFLVIQAGLLVVSFLLAALLSGRVFVGAIFGAAGFFLPVLYLRRARSTHLRLFNSLLADSLLMMANSLKSGFSFLSAMDMASREMPAPLSVEWGLTLKEIHLGTTTEQALTNLSKRVGSTDLDLMVTAIVIQRQVGGNLSEVLTNIHDTIADRIRIQKEIKTLTAQGRYSGYLIAALPFLIAFLLLIINPAYLLVLFTSPAGWAMIGAGIFSQGIGFLIIRKIVNIRV